MKKTAPVLFVHHSNDLYGADVMLLETVKGLDPEQFTPYVVLPDDCKAQGGLAAELEKAKIPYQFIPLAVIRRKYFKLGHFPTYCLEAVRAIGALRRIIREQRIQIVHSNTLAVATGALAARITGKKHIWHIHEILVSPKAVRKLLHFLAPRMSQAVICISNAVRDHVLADQPQQGGKLTVIYNGLSLDRFLAAHDGSAFRSEMGIPPHAPLAGMIGRINHWKGQQIFAQAAKLVLSKIPDAYFVAVGGIFANERQSLDGLLAEIQQLGISSRFLISDFRTDTPSVLASMDLYIHPSLSPEPFGLVVVEAMAAGKTVIATAHGGPLEIIEQDSCGYLVEPGSASALANKIIESFENPDQVRSIGIRARERAVGIFSVSHYLEQVEALYKKVLQA